MSVTTVLVPVHAPEVEALLAGGETPDLIPRAERLRARVARLDAVREDLHALLVSRWEAEIARAPRYRHTLLTRFVGSRQPPQIPSGYDPYVHLFGRSFPVAGGSSKVVAQRISELFRADDDAFEAGMEHDLELLHAEAPRLFAQVKARNHAVAAALEAERMRIAQAMQAAPIRPREAYDAVMAVCAWSWPVWRLDGIMLGDLARVLGITVSPAAAAELFEEAKDARPEIEPFLAALPKSLENFAGAGAFWSPTEVKLVAGSLRLYRTKLAQNAVTNGDDPASALRQLRLLEEAVLFCEGEGLGLAEAAGIEWHDRRAS